MCIRLEDTWLNEAKMKTAMKIQREKPAQIRIAFCSGVPNLSQQWMNFLMQIFAGFFIDFVAMHHIGNVRLINPGYIPAHLCHCGSSKRPKSSQIGPAKNSPGILELSAGVLRYYTPLPSSLQQEGHGRSCCVPTIPRACSGLLAGMSYTSSRMP